MFKKLFRKFFPNKTAVDFPGGYIPNRFFIDRVKKGPILVIGDYIGRDYKPLKEKFREVYLLDVVDNKIAEGKYFICQSITETSSFPEGFFNYVIIAEVIEHVWEDKKTLEEIRRALSLQGTLLLSVPFYHDFHDRHYHIYSPKTIELLLNHSGFSIEEKQYRGLVVSIPNEIIALFSLLLRPLFGNNSLKKVNRLLYNFHKKLSRFKKLNSLFRFNNKFFKGFGVILSAKKSNEKIDPIEIQRKSFKKNKYK